MAAENTFRPTVEWLPEPRPVKNSAATTEADMKPYTETLPRGGHEFDMVPIPGGRFMMGSPAAEPHRHG